MHKPLVVFLATACACPELGGMASLGDDRAEAERALAETERLSCLHRKLPHVATVFRFATESPATRNLM